MSRLTPEREAQLRKMHTMCARSSKRCYGCDALAEIDALRLDVASKDEEIARLKERLSVSEAEVFDAQCAAIDAAIGER